MLVVLGECNIACSIFTAFFVDDVRLEGRSPEIQVGSDMKRAGLSEPMVLLPCTHHTCSLKISNFDMISKPAFT